MTSTTYRDLPGNTSRLTQKHRPYTDIPRPPLLEYNRTEIAVYVEIPL